MEGSNKCLTYKSRRRTTTPLLLACLKAKQRTKQVPFCAPGLCSGFPRLTYPGTRHRISPSDASSFTVLRTVVTQHKCLTKPVWDYVQISRKPLLCRDNNPVLSVLKRNSALELHLLAEECPKAKVLLTSHPDGRNVVVG